MFYKYDHPSVRYTGRYGKCGDTMTATATGSIIEIAFEGEAILLHFNTDTNKPPFPHLYLSVDGEGRTEVPLDRYIRVETKDGKHLLKIIYKGGREMLSRFCLPLEGKVSFEGYDAERCGVLPEDGRKSIEFVGDSITEGVLIDAFLCPDENDGQNNRPYQDDVTATYAWLTAEALNLKPLFMGYGAVGVTKGGCGGYPKVIEGYPFCFEGVPVGYGHPDYIVINHGANDRGNGEKLYLKEYEAFLYAVRKTHPSSQIFCLSPFLGFCAEGLEKLVERFNRENSDTVRFICGANLIPVEPVHPLRDGHKVIAGYLTEQLGKFIR